MIWGFWRRPKPASKDPLLPMTLQVDPLPNGKGAVFQVFLDEHRELIFVLNKPGIARLVDAILEAGLVDDDESA